MGKKYKLYIILTLLLLELLSVHNANAEQKFTTSASKTSITTQEGSIVVQPTPSTVLAPQGLAAQEQKQLENQYAFTFRNKAQILSPYLSAGGGEGAIEEKRAEYDEQEKLYRYFGVANKLYKEGKMPEAVEILRYILKRNPNDKYVKSYLDNIMTEDAFKKRDWQVMTESDARLLKNKRIKNLLKDGIDYYKQKRFDMALMKFSDLLEIDPANQDAKRYIDKLKSYYMDEVKVEDIVNSYEEGTKSRDISEEEKGERGPAVEERSSDLLDREENKIEEGAKRLLDKKETKVNKVADHLLNKQEPPLSSEASKLLDKGEFQELVREKKLNSLMDEADLGIEVEDIIAKKKDEEIRSNLFTLGPGDILQIAVRDHPELSGTSVVRLNGTIALPLVNEAVRASGLTVSEVAENVKQALKRYVKDASVLVAVQEYHSKTFYVIDETGARAYNITRANFTLRDALFVSDWGDNRALGRVIVVKPDKLHPIVRKIDAFDIIYRGNVANNIKIENGDVVYIPLTIAAKTTKVISDTIAPFNAIRSARDQWVNFKADQKSWKEIPKWRGSIHDMNVNEIWSSSSTGGTV